VLVLIHGRPLSIPGLVERVPAILDGWYLGQETGTAVAEALFGDINPGGKLPVTVARHVGQLPVFYNRKPSARRGYVLDSVEPLFPFGYGLSYTTFAYANLRVTPARIGPGERSSVSIDVSNTGRRAGDEVVQLYIRDAVSWATRPLTELRGFRRVSLQPGETRTVTFDIGPEHLAYHGADMKRVVEPGRFEILVGGSSADLHRVALDVVETPRAGSLRDAFDGAFLVGAALNAAQFSERDTLGAAIVSAQFNATTPENALKWASLHPRPGTYDFAAADQYVAFGERHSMFIVGHTLVWHNQTPPWVFQDASGNPVSRDTLLARLRDHIHTVVGRYRGRIKGWDVVNEALNDDGTLRPTPWLRIIGEDYIAQAFRFAHEADPDAELYYNDYSLENAPKRRGALALIERLKAAGVPIAGVGLQGHDRLDWPTAAQQDSTIAAFAALGVHVMITELDIDVLPPDQNPYSDSLPDALQTALARRYAELFAVYRRHADAVTRVTFWGVSDGDSWLNNWPVRGRRNYPLLFDRQHRPKPAFDAVLGVGRQAAGR
jgi:endo-1,4-beta-xylanase